MTDGDSGRGEMHTLGPSASVRPLDVTVDRTLWEHTFRI